MRHKVHGGWQDDVAGWFGTLLIVLAYALLSFGVLDAGMLSYQFLNLLGAVGIVWNSFSEHAYPPGVLNIIWGVIALVAIFNILF